MPATPRVPPLMTFTYSSKSSTGAGAAPTVTTAVPVATDVTVPTAPTTVFALRMIKTGRAYFAMNSAAASTSGPDVKLVTMSLTRANVAGVLIGPLVAAPMIASKRPAVVGSTPSEPSSSVMLTAGVVIVDLHSAAQGRAQRSQFGFRTRRVRAW